MSLDSKELEDGNYVNRRPVTINNIDYSEVIPLKPSNLKTCINIVSSNGYSVIKNKIIMDVSNLNYTIGPRGLYGEYCGTDDDERFVFKMLKNTTIIDNSNGKNTGIEIPINTKLVLAKDSSKKGMFIEKNVLIDSNSSDSKLQNTAINITNDAYRSVKNIGKMENVIPSGGSSKKYKKTGSRYRSKALLKKHKTRKNNKTSKK
jgi:hypothetical protein